MLRHFDDQLFAVIVKFYRIQQGGQLAVLEADVQDRAGDLHHLSDVFFWHSTHSFVGFLRFCVGTGYDLGDLLGNGSLAGAVIVQV